MIYSGFQMKRPLICCFLAFLLMQVASAILASPTQYNVHEQELLQETGPTTFVAGYPVLGAVQFSLVAAIDTGGASLSAAPILRLASGGNVTFPVGPNSSPGWQTGKGYNEYHWGDGWTTAAALNANDGSGTFTLTMGDATATPTLQLDTANPDFPVSPTLTSGGIWSGGHLLIDVSTGATLTFNTSAFVGYTNGNYAGAQIKFEMVDSNLMPTSAPAVSQSFPSQGQNQPALTSYTIGPGALIKGQSYNVQANYTQYVSLNTTPFSGTGISGNPVGASGYLTSTFIRVDAVLYKLSAAPTGPNTVHLQGKGVPNVVNRIESSPDLSPGSFSTLVSVNADSTGAIQYDDISAGTKKFYRLAYP